MGASVSRIARLWCDAAGGQGFGPNEQDDMRRDVPQLWICWVVRLGKRESDVTIELPQEPAECKIAFKAEAPSSVVHKFLHGAPDANTRWVLPYIVPSNLRMGWRRSGVPVLV